MKKAVCITRLLYESNGLGSVAARTGSDAFCLPNARTHISNHTNPKPLKEVPLSQSCPKPPDQTHHITGYGLPKRGGDWSMDLEGRATPKSRQPILLALLLLFAPFRARIMGKIILANAMLRDNRCAGAPARDRCRLDGLSNLGHQG